MNKIVSPAYKNMQNSKGYSKTLVLRNLLLLVVKSLFGTLMLHRMGTDLEIFVNNNLAKVSFTSSSNYGFENIPFSPNNYKINLRLNKHEKH